MATTPTLSLNIGPPEWKNVRAIYKRLSDEFDVLLQPYSIALSPVQKDMLDHLIIAIDRIDDYIDNIDDKQQRDDVVKYILQQLKDQGFEPDDAGLVAPIKKPTKVLAHIIDYLGIRQSFGDAAHNIFYNTEEKRWVDNPQKLLRYVMDEGAATASLPLSIMQIQSTHPFAQFFRDLCILMGIADLFIDLKKDFKDHIIVVPPRILLRIHLLLLVMYRGIRLFIKFPRRLSLFAYCLRFGWLLLREP